MNQLNKIRIATRQSQLAMVQTNHVADLLKHAYPNIEIEYVKLSTLGDEVLDRPLADIGGKALFVQNLEQSLVDLKADICVHSLKDVPSVLTAEFNLCAYLTRENPFDVFVSKEYATLADLPDAAKVGTCSPRRAAQLKRARRDLNIVLLRGNVPTRLQKIQTEMDGAVLAAAGLRRLGLESHIRAYFDEAVMLPAPGQGIVAIECLSNRKEVYALMRVLNDPDAEACALAERAVSAGLNGNCHSPIAAFATVDGNQLSLKGRVVSSDGFVCLDASLSGSVEDAEDLGQQVAKHLLEQGAEQYL